ncbi:carboxypeptidase-like regulatory domain-containing protein [Cytophagaceae bacterium DM2B3-1]|uniref:Carboxypeptidase-like regulatory domain-containing protein n=1 Tax=Xanthocytophaga flava TaxID=3048013 RepID=A0ABT7CYC3_9BACT|nr:carboxypeptidase-like regulatory domain-containing protein [Xanthocytophaga flavus]MDJ1498780.1 carboxypeptidase-like regulatory domain-containing protein [Xanthocytophaga flavus]
MKPPSITIPSITIPSITIQIPTPCHQDWSQMQPNPQGRHCLSCQKTVIDFTQMSQKELVTFFKNRQDSVCGRFRDDQLNRSLSVETYSSSTPTSFTSRWKMFVLAVSATLTMKTIFAEKVKAQIPVEQREMEPVSRVERADSEPDTFLAFGKVITQYQQRPFENVTVIIKNTRKSTVTNSNGMFYLPDARRGDILIFSARNCPTQEVTLQSDDPIRVVFSGEFHTVLGGAYSVVQRPFYQRIFHKVKSWFQ